jgi:ATP-binding cassette subfamily B protein
VASLAAGAWLYRTSAVSLGTVFLLFQYTALLRRPLELIADQLQRVQEAVAGVSRAAELLRLPRRVTGGGARPLPPGPLEVVLDGVSFAYEGGSEALRDVSLRLAPGTVLGVVGRTGSGKTTLGRLLVRLADPTAGTVGVGGADLRSARIEDVRARIGFVPQEVHLFGASLRDNLTLFGAHPAGDGELAGALDGLGLGPWWRALPDGLDTMLTSGGTGASAGEAQLVAFARVFLRDPGLVVLDEASSRIDPVTQARVQRAMDHLLAGRTAAVIAHRLSTLDRADQVLVLEDGLVVEHGGRPALAIDPSTWFARMLGAERRGGRVPVEAGDGQAW